MHYIAFYCILVMPFGNLLIVTSAEDVKNSTAGSEKNGFGSSKESITCKTRVLNTNIQFQENGDAFIVIINKTVPSSEFWIRNGNFLICLALWEVLQKCVLQYCERASYASDEYEVLPNASILLYGDILENGTYEFEDGELLTCALDYDISNYNSSIMNHNPINPSDKDWLFIYIARIGAFISILALLAHLATFCLVPFLRNLPDYNLCSLSIALLFAYSFLLIGQIPEILGTYCVIIGVLQQNFFLAAFFCMNVMAFDIWRTIRMVTQKLMVSSSNFRRKQFLWNTLYAWGIPLAITITSVVIDNTENVPENIKPHFGKSDTCWVINDLAKIIFFAVPAFILFTANSIFFVFTAFQINSNTMKNSKDQQVNAEKINFILYLKLGLIMGITWLVAVIAAVLNSNVLWNIFEVLNSLQGLFLFLIFVFSKKVCRHFSKRTFWHTEST